ncbi:hypothetical protein EIP91_007625 [Steccherinum ochraceum]|uniref:Uncharacterized protein n=1 Tax=Steccherinum ochraceum TaxID=92696 RepID=A0A4V2MVD6_9APHY|nr:hypothetical protein EIP91_007625 [Steccherinum ochraceum]
MSEPRPLERDSLYVLLRPLQPEEPNDGMFHWELLITDASGTAARHHWVRVHSSYHVPEKYVCEPNLPASVLTRTARGAMYVLYAKVPGFIGVPAGFDFGKETDRLFAGAKAHTSYLQNKQKQMNCRTWIRGILGAWEREGAVRLSDGVLSFTEAVWKIAYEASLEHFLLHGDFECWIVEDVDDRAAKVNVADVTEQFKEVADLQRPLSELQERDGYHFLNSTGCR